MASISSTESSSASAVAQKESALAYKITRISLVPWIGGSRRLRSQKAGEACDLQGRRASRLANLKDTFCRIVVADDHILGLRIQPNSTDESGVVHPLLQHKLVLVLDVRADEVAKQPPLDAVVGLPWDIGRAVGDAPPNKTAAVVAAARSPLAGHWLVTRIDPADVRANGAAQALRVAGPVRVHIPAIPYNLPRGSTMGYMPELNVLCAIGDYSLQSDQPLMKHVVVEVTPTMTRSG
jgi:hypothetical protein